MIAVVDTNVLLVANGQHEGMSPQSILECSRRLADLHPLGYTEFLLAVGKGQLVELLARLSARTRRLNRAYLTLPYEPTIIQVRVLP